MSFVPIIENAKVQKWTRFAKQPKKQVVEIAVRLAKKYPQYFDETTFEAGEYEPISPIRQTTKKFAVYEDEATSAPYIKVGNKSVYLPENLINNK